MKIKVEQFCSLATSPSFQTWLFHYDKGLYQQFVVRLREARGCSENRELMKTLLAGIERQGGADEVTDFLRKHYPNTIEGGVKALVGDYDKVFTHYNPNILTYPRRIIFTGPKRELQKKVREFLLDKLKSDHIVVGDRAYVEYLEESDASITDKIPLCNWQIAAYRQR